MAYMKKPSKKMYGGKKKKMYKKGSFLEPGKEIKFGGVKKMQAAGTTSGRPGVGRPTNQTADKNAQKEKERLARAEARKKRAADAAASNARQRAVRDGSTMDKIAAMGTGATMPKPQEIGAKKASSGKSDVTKLRESLDKKPGPKTGPKPGTYAYAKKRNPNLDKLIKQRKGLTKGTEEYNRVQNLINRAYGKGPMRKEISKVAAKPAAKNTAKPTLKTPAKPAAPAAKKPAPKPAPRPKVTPSGGSGMGAVNKMDDLKKELKGAASSAKKPMDRRGKRAARKSERLKKRVSRLQGKMMGGGKYKMGYKAGGEKKKSKGSFPDLTGDGKVTRADILKGRGVFKSGGGMSGLSAAQKQVYKRGLAAYMSSGNRPKVSQHAWAMARVKSDFGKREAAKIRAGKSGKGKKK